MLTKTHLKTLCGSVILGCLAALSTPAMAANDAMVELIEIMRKKGSITEEEYKLLKNAAHADAEVATAAKDEVKKEVEAATKDLPKIETAGKLKVSSQDGDFSWGLIGRIHADYNLVHTDENKIGNDAFIRRARLGMEGTMWKHWIWKLEMDFAEDALSTKDAFIGYKDKTAGGAGWWVKAGQSHIPFGLATISSSKYMLFVERPLLADGPLQPSRQLGFAGFVNDANGRWTFHTGIFGGAVGSGGAGITDEFNAAARGTFVPFMQDKTHLASLGAGVWYRNAMDKGTRINQRPGIFRSGSSSFQDANFGIGGIDTLGFNVEGLVVYGPFNAQAEYSTRSVDTPVGDVDLDGYYAEAGWFLTGESMNYDTGKAQFGSVKPKGIVGKGGIGAWQLALRYDVLDLNEAVDVLGVGTGGEQRSLSAGLNWYVNNNMRFMLNYINVMDMDRFGSTRDNDEPHGMTLRGEVFW